MQFSCMFEKKVGIVATIFQAVSPSPPPLNYAHQDLNPGGRPLRLCRKTKLAPWDYFRLLNSFNVFVQSIAKFSLLGQALNYRFFPLDVILFAFFLSCPLAYRVDKIVCYQKISSGVSTYFFYNDTLEPL
jgi:hypothetical protein